MSSRTGRNDPCWCGSGRKYKHCHLHRADQAPRPLFEVADELRRANKAYCLHPQAGPGVCRGGIVRAHTVQRSGGLSRIARDGHVYRFASDLLALDKNNGTFPVTPVGVKQATTFTGFCALHDAATFRPLETQPFVASPEQVFLLGYRAVCRELYTKRWEAAVVPSHREADRGLAPLLQRAHQAHVDRLAFSMNAGLTDVEHTKAAYDDALLRGDFSRVSAYVLHFDRTPDVLCSGGCLLEADFAGNPLQREALSDPAARPAETSLSILPTDTGGAAVFCWLGHTEAGAAFTRSLDALADDGVGHAVVRFVFEFLENKVMAPSWWDGLPEAARQALTQRMMTALNPFVEREPTCLLDDGVRAVNWRVTARSVRML